MNELRVFTRTTTSFYTTPSELRQIADRMESVWSTALPGDILPKYSFSGDRGVDIEICIDQPAMHLAYGAPGSKL